MSCFALPPVVLVSDGVLCNRCVREFRERSLPTAISPTMIWRCSLAQLGVSPTIRKIGTSRLRCSRPRVGDQHRAAGTFVCPRPCWRSRRHSTSQKCHPPYEAGGGSLRIAVLALSSGGLVQHRQIGQVGGPSAARHGSASSAANCKRIPAMDCGGQSSASLQRDTASGGRKRCSRRPCVLEGWKLSRPVSLFLTTPKQVTSTHAHAHL